MIFKSILLSFTILFSSFLCELSNEFEIKHMKEIHQMEVSDAATFFKIHDSDKNGFWDEKELLNIYGVERDVDPEAEHLKSIVEHVFSVMDLNKDRLISQDEYTSSKFLPSITKDQEKKEKEMKSGKNNSKKQQKKSSTSNNNNNKRGDDYEFVVPAKFRA
ncbi:hypothetical protein RMCBS344292_05300 [Rhizopus microsporus]|nr:hypothetical protein RMCBS344292_05300 [Rhizopus microsporus]